MAERDDRGFGRRELQHLLLHPFQLFMPRIFMVERFNRATLMIIVLLLTFMFVFSLRLLGSPGVMSAGESLKLVVW